MTDVAICMQVYIRYTSIQLLWIPDGWLQQPIALNHNSCSSLPHVTVRIQLELDWEVSCSESDSGEFLRAGILVRVGSITGF
jgi:hypothetical protein